MCVEVGVFFGYTKAARLFIVAVVDVRQLLMCNIVLGKPSYFHLASHLSYFSKRKQLIKRETKQAASSDTCTLFLSPLENWVLRLMMKKYYYFYTNLCFSGHFSFQNNLLLLFFFCRISFEHDLCN